ncbi:hypothetical protein [Acinetobacter baumannii]|uniref:hypothetical protein n=1 Tax=Acinetobacter baumannii TaxID=470 RepID=UPI000C706FA3|nr:hypothetical protein [Acinetobacter baumannii]MPU13705.1 hypothetical protein [Acinetobacter baumannii]NCG58679.1 hypothetical protein [Acinetobacter baumannii]PQL70132.1 hypothetical protein CV956_006095 [Acinetobacter baumannii]PQL88194.1 hypothetical protein CV955_0006855 [Acinetobacter baumannii]HAV6019702.1 hypothetical protein [Acinetobacter baumannii]
MLGVVVRELKAEVKDNLIIEENKPFVFRNGDNKGLFLIRSLDEGSFDYLDQKFFIRTFTYTGNLIDLVRPASEEERLMGHRI